MEEHTFTLTFAISGGFQLIILAIFIRSAWSFGNTKTSVTTSAVAVSLIYGKDTGRQVDGRCTREAFHKRPNVSQLEIAELIDQLLQK